MISIYQIKPAFQKLLLPILKKLHSFGVTANQITLSSILFSLIIGILFWNAQDNRWYFLALPVGLLLRMALNALDGMMARNYNQQSKKGEVLNELGDVISDLFIFFPLLKHEPQHTLIIVIFICLSIVNEFSGILSKAVSGQRRYDGPMGKSDRAFVISLYGILQFFYIEIGSFAYWIFLILIILLIISTGLRIKHSID